jgi:adenylate kinase family enzyme
MNRIVIVGSGGSGKSTLAKQLSLVLGLDVVHLDSVFWKPGWNRTSPLEQQCILNKIVCRSRWIIDGDHIRTQPFRFAASDTIIFLDFPRAICLWRMVKRFVQNRGKNRLGMAEGCPERINWTLLRWVWHYPLDNRPQVIENIKRYAEGNQVIVLKRPKEVKTFLADLMTAK